MKEEVEIEVPKFAQFLKAEMQDGFIVVWAIVNENEPIEKRQFRLYKTGQQIKVAPKHLYLLGRADIHVGMDLGIWVFEYITFP